MEVLINTGGLRDEPFLHQLNPISSPMLGGWMETKPPFYPLHPPVEQNLISRHSQQLFATVIRRHDVLNGGLSQLSFFGCGCLVCFDTFYLQDGGLSREAASLPTTDQHQSSSCTRTEEQRRTLLSLVAFSCLKWSNNRFQIAGHKQQKKKEFEDSLIDQVLAIIYPKMHSYNTYRIGERNMNFKYVEY